MSLPATKKLTIVQGATFTYAIQRITESQTIDLGVSGGGVTGTWVARVVGATGTPTAALAHNATPADVQAALAALGSVGGGKVAVVDNGGTGKYKVTFTDPERATTAELLPIQITPSFTPQTAPLVGWVPFDWTDWTASLKIAPLVNGVFDTAYLTLTDTASADGQVIFGYIYPPAEGGTEPTPDPTNGVIAIRLTNTATGGLTNAQFQGKTVQYALFAILDSYYKAVEDGAVALALEPV